MTENIIKKPSWWNKRSTLEKSLLLILGLTILAAVILGLGILLLIFSVVKTTLPNPASTCMTPACLEAASLIIKRMNRSVEPCENFYEFACGNFKNIGEIPKSEERVSTLSIIDNKVHDQLKNLLEEPSLTDEARSITLSKKFYKACIDEDLIDEQGIDPIKNLINELGGWPVLKGNDWNENDFDWKELNYKLRNKGLMYNQLVNFYIYKDAKDEKEKVFYLQQASLDIPKEYLDSDMENPILKSYYQYMIDLTTIMGANETRAKIEMNEMFLFQRNLSEISLSKVELRNASALYNKMTIAELQKQHPYIEWLEYFNKILSPVVQINETEIIINETPAFFIKFEELLNKTPKRTIANYIYWCVVRNVIYTLPKIIQKQQQTFLKSAIGIAVSEPRWKTCVDKTRGYFDLVTGSLYVRKYFDRESKEKISDIVHNIKNSFKEDLESNKWMDTKTKMIAIDKLKLMFEHVAYPDELLDNEKLDSVYKDLSVDENSYLFSILSINKFWIDDDYRKLREPVNKTDWKENGNVAKAAAFYYPNKNSFTLPAGILQDIFFSSSHPNYMNYGAIGFTIGHEITHGFDNEGRQYDKNGEVFNWWDLDTEKAFQEKAQCFIDQYNNYHVTEINQNIDGELTLGENIADNGGLKQAYLAYKKWLQKNKEEQLPGLSYTPLQMFWISLASTWCTLDRPESLKLLVKGDVHAPYSYRIIGSVSNRPEFAEDFHCSTESKMNPKNRCHVW